MNTLLRLSFTPCSSAAWATARVPVTGVLHRFARIAFHQRHMLVRCLVKGNLRTLLGEHLVESIAISDVAKHGDGLTHPLVGQFSDD